MRHAPGTIFTTATPIRHADAVPVSRLHIAWTTLGWLIGLPGRIAAARRDMALLGQMSGHELADIGLVRQDLWDAAALPLGSPPGHLLARRATERRRAALSHHR